MRDDVVTRSEPAASTSSSLPESFGIYYDSQHLQSLFANNIDVDLTGILRGRMASAEGGSVSNGVGYGEGCPLSSRLGVWGSVVSSPSGGPKTDFGVF